MLFPKAGSTKQEYIPVFREKIGMWSQGFSSRETQNLKAFDFQASFDLKLALEKDTILGDLF